MEHGNKAEHEFEIHVHVSRRKEVCSRTSLSKEFLYKSPTWILSFCQSNLLKEHPHLKKRLKPILAAVRIVSFSILSGLIEKSRLSGRTKTRQSCPEFRCPCRTRLVRRRLFTESIPIDLNNLISRIPSGKFFEMETELYFSFRYKVSTVFLKLSFSDLEKPQDTDS